MPATAVGCRIEWPVKRIRKIWLVAALCSAAAMSSAGFAQELPDRSEAAVDSLLDPPLAAVRPLRFERATADLGTLREEDAPYAGVSYSRTGATKRLPSSGSASGAGVSRPSGRRAASPPEPKVRSSLTYDPENHPGRIDVKCFRLCIGTGPQARCAADVHGRSTACGESLGALPACDGGVAAQTEGRGVPRTGIRSEGYGTYPLRQCRRTAVAVVGGA